MVNILQIALIFSLIIVVGGIFFALNHTPKKLKDWLRSIRKSCQGGIR